MLEYNCNAFSTRLNGTKSGTNQNDEIPEQADPTTTDTQLLTPNKLYYNKNPTPTTHQNQCSSMFAFSAIWTSLPLHPALDVNEVDCRKRTHFHCAAEDGHEEM